MCINLIYRPLLLKQFLSDTLITLKGHKKQIKTKKWLTQTTT